tara:strand:- start:1289 stop:2401 length:1113 start_codon:yes stop_codon:yes gene_type:complete
VQRKKILFYHPFFADGGVEKTNLLISEKLAKKYEIIFVSNSFSKKFNLDIKRIGIKKITLSSSRTLFSFFELSKIFKKIKPEIIIPVQMHANVLVLAINKFLFKNKLKIICCERLSKKRFQEYFIKGKIIIFLAKILYKNAKKIICNSKDLATEFKKISKANNVTYIYNPTLKLNYRSLAKKIKIKEKPFFPKIKPILFSLGRLDDVKNQMMLLKAYNEIKNYVSCNIVLMGEGKKKDELIKYAKKNKFSKNFFLFDFKKNPFPYLSKSDLFILTSNYEGLPNVLIEALSLNIPVISTNSPTGPREILLNGNAGFLIKKNDYKDLSKKIKLFFENPKIFNNKRKFYKKSLKKFSPKKSLDQYEKIVKSLM